jgi:pyruvate dehydrogenase kinase 2/3/4
MSRDPNFPQATENPSLDPLMHEGPSGSNLAMDKAWTPGSNGAGSGSATRMRIPIERRYVLLPLSPLVFPDTDNQIFLTTAQRYNLPTRSP